MNFPPAESFAVLVRRILKMAYVYLMNNKKALNLETVKKHVQYLKNLDDLGKLILCGPFWEDLSRT